MGPFAALNSAFANIFNFSGRATRSEFWWFFLICLIVGFVTLTVDMFYLYSVISTEGDAAILGLSPFDFYTVWVSLLTSIPYLSLSIRRLHDAGFSGFWWLINFVPLGSVALLILYCLPSQNSQNSYGQPPSGGNDVAGRPITPDAQKRAMQGYACLFEVDREPTPEMVAARKSEVSEYYRSKVLNKGTDPEPA